MNTPESQSKPEPVAVVSSDWLAVSEDARATMQELGDFRPTVRPENREIKGYPQADGKTYYDADELRKMATHFVEVADWLDARAAEALANDKDEPRAAKDSKN